MSMPTNDDADLTALLASIARIRNSIREARQIAQRQNSVYGVAYCVDLLSLSEEYEQRVRLSQLERDERRAGQAEFTLRPA